jgi:ligand-binding sensor domain-containing protein/two-component sensor histidine kinase
MRGPLVILFLFVYAGIYCQELSHKQYTVKDGLPGSVVYHTVQDRNGFIWFATNQGVSRFDGKTFTNFTKEDGLPDNEILKLYLDKYNNIWFISFAGIPAVFHNNVIKRFDNCKKVIAICEDIQNDSIFLYTNYHLDNDSVLFFYKSPNYSGKWQFTEYQKNDLPYGLPFLKASSPKKINFYFSIAGKQKQVLSLKHESLTKEYFFKSSNEWPLPFSGKSFISFTEDKKAIVFSSSNALFFGNLNEMKVITSLKQLKLTYNDINYLFCENDSALWICTRTRGLLCIKNFLTSQHSVHAFFPQKFCTSILKDKEHGYWVTTHGDGVYFIPNPDFYILSAYSDINGQNALCIRPVGKQQLGVGFADGNVTKINFTNLRREVFPVFTAKNKNSRVVDIWPFGNNDLLVACDDAPYIISGRKSRKLPADGVKALYVSNANIFIACYAYVWKLDRQGKFVQLLFKKRITCITGNDSILYWGTLQGLYSCFKGNIQFLGEKYPGLSGIINHIDIAADSSIWISTQQGIVVMKNNITLLTIKKEDGLLSNSCKHVSFDKNTAWIATDKGISRIDYHWIQNRMKYSISNITEEDGLITNDVNQTTLAGNNVWAATAAGICWFSKNYISRSVISPLINIDRIIAGDSILPVKDTIQISYRTGKLLIELSGISFRSGKQMQYEYRLNGADSNWSSTVNNEIEFSALPFGKFIFEVRSVDRWGAKSGRPKRIIIIHSPPFWKTTWFLVSTYFLLAASLGAGFYMFYRSRNRKREQEYQLKKKVHDLEMMALRAQMNPHFIFNCLTSIQYHIIRADIRNANTYLHKFSTLIRQILQHSTDSTISLRDEIKILELYLELEKLRLNERMDYRLIVPDDLDQDNVYIPSMIVQPYIENAIKHGIAPLQHRKGILTVEIKQSGGCIEFIIEDNGPGIHDSMHRNSQFDQEYTSMGTGITEKRINAINDIQKNKILCRITDKLQAGQAGSGTIVHLSFPVLP